MTDSNIDMCAVCGLFGNLICCDTCPMSFHAECIGYSSLDFIGDDQEWSCWECCRKRPNVSFLYDTTPVFPEKGTYVYVATQHSCLSYVRGQVHSCREDEIGLQLKCQGKHINFDIGRKDKRIWRGQCPVKKASRYKMLLEEPNGKYVPAFHKVDSEKVLAMPQNSQHAPAPAKQPKAEKPKPKEKRGREEPPARLDTKLSDLSAAEVLGSLHIPQQTTKAVLSSMQRSNRLKMTALAMKLKEGDKVEVWIEATDSTPGGWAPGTLSKIVMVGDGSLYPFFSFYLVKFDHLDVTIHGELYSEWRPLAHNATNGQSHGISVQVRAEQKKKPHHLTVVRVGDMIEARINGFSCPGIVRKIDDKHKCTIEFQSPHLNRRHKIPMPHSASLKRQAEEPFHGMLSIAS